MVAIARQSEFVQVLALYCLDGLGNWRRFITDPVGGSAVTQIRQHNGLNEITRTTVSSTNTNFAYDGVAGASNGNLKDDGTLFYTWDALNRLKQVKRKSDNATIGDYTYDALNRRIRIVVSNGGLSGTVPNGTTDCLYQEWRCVEERDGSNNPTKQYVWGIYLDELIQQKNITALNNFGTNAELYPLQDLLYRTMALADSSGTVREAYDYDAYGNTLIFRNSGSPPSAITWTNSDTQVVNPTCVFLFTGQRYNAETRNYYFKMRYYAPVLGRFVSRDKLLYQRDPWLNVSGTVDFSTEALRIVAGRRMIISEHCNPFMYVGSKPTSGVDPDGQEYAQDNWNSCSGNFGGGDVLGVYTSHEYIAYGIGIPYQCNNGHPTFGTTVQFHVVTYSSQYWPSWRNSIMPNRPQSIAPSIVNVKTECCPSGQSGVRVLLQINPNWKVSNHPVTCHAHSPLPPSVLLDLLVLDECCT
jgi:RHS repeat-associated protein